MFRGGGEGGGGAGVVEGVWVDIERCLTWGGRQ